MLGDDDDEEEEDQQDQDLALNSQPIEQDNDDEILIMDEPLNDDVVMDEQIIPEKITQKLAPNRSNESANVIYEIQTVAMSDADEQIERQLLDLDLFYLRPEIKSSSPVQEQLIDLTKHIAQRKLKKIDDLIKSAQEIDVADLASFGLGKEEKANPF